MLPQVVRRWLGLTPHRLAHVHFILYTRTGCHLCDEAWQRLQRAQQRFSFPLKAVDVDTDPALAARYGDCVPVVTVDGKERFRGGVSTVLLDRLLRAEARASRRG